MNYDEITRMVADESTDLIYLADPATYELIYLNRAALNRFGLSSPEQWKGRSCHHVLQGREKPCSFCTNLSLSEDEYYCWQYHNPTLQRDFWVRDKLVRFQDRLVRLEIATDISAQLSAQRQLQHRLYTEETLVRCIRTLNHSDDLNQAINELLSIICEYHMAKRAYIFQMDSGGQHLSNTHEWCAQGVSSELSGLQSVPVSVISRWLDLFQREDAVYIPNLDIEVDHQTDEYALLHQQGIRCLMAAPLRQQGTVIGLLGVDNPAARTDDITLLRSTASFIVNDLSKHRLIGELQRLSLTDSLTGLFNRHKYIRVLAALEARPPASLGVAFLDINGLKAANDTHGHRYGDYVIIHAAEAIRASFTGELYRIGGDEFVVLCPDIEKQAFNEQLNRLRRAIREDDELDLAVGSTWREGRMDVQKQITRTDALMYEDKQLYYHTRHNDAGDYRAGLARELLREIDAGGFCVLLQPKIDLQTGEVNGAEALVRKRGESGELVPASDFVPRYETEGIVLHMDLFVLGAVCDIQRRWLESGYQPLRISVNVSRVTLMRRDIAERLADVCHKHGMKPSLINLEVSGAVSAMEPNELSELMHSLIERGFALSLDNFGADCANLSLLSAVHFTEVKLDRRLISGLSLNPQSLTLVKHTISLCRDLNLPATVAEGVETLQQKELLARINCTVGQGYYFDQPMTADAFTDKYIASRA